VEVRRWDTTLYIGCLNASHIRVGEVFREAVERNAMRRNAAAIIVVHNHPSGDPTPSPEDVEATRHVYAAGEMIDVELLDHLIIGRSVSSACASAGWVSTRPKSGTRERQNEHKRVDGLDR
jgi:DNA repair protein RadC